MTVVKNERGKRERWKGIEVEYQRASAQLPADDSETAAGRVASLGHTGSAALRRLAPAVTLALLPFAARVRPFFDSCDSVAAELHTFRTTLPSAND